MRTLVIYFSFFLSHVALAAAPTVSSVVLDQSGITILGKNFGSENPMLFWDSADTSLANFRTTEGAQVPEQLWKQNGNIWGKPMIFTKKIDTRTPRGNFVYFGEGHKNFLGDPIHPKRDSLKNKIFVSWWYKPSKSPSSEGGANKFIRIWDDRNGKGTRISWTQNLLACGEGMQQWGGWNGNVNQWNHHVIYVDLEEKKARTWINGKQLHEIDCIKHEDYPNVPLYVGLIGFDHGSAAYRTMETAIDDIYIGSSLARVEISDSAKWSPTMNNEILPISSWSNDKIVTKLRDGIVKLSGQSYIYVYNEQGVANANGIKIDCQACPKITD